MFALVKDTQQYVARFVFGDSLCSFLALRLTTVSLEHILRGNISTNASVIDGSEGLGEGADSPLALLLPPWT